MIDQSIKEGIYFLKTIQEADGSFSSLTSSNFNDFTEARVVASVFSSALILANLQIFEEKSDIENINKKLSKFLLSQKNENWSFNYWKRNSEQSINIPYPDDLDDTFCALSSLYRYDANLIGGEAMAKIVAILTSLEVQEGGPYRTWIVPSDAEKVWRDIDLAVNNNIAYFLSLQEVELPNLVLLIEKAIEEERYYSPYYPSEYPIMYFISRWYQGGKAEKTIQYLLSKKIENNWGNALNTALSISALLNLKFPAEKLKESIDCLLADQKNGSWESYGFCFDPAIKGNAYYAGSSSLTTAFCLEALQKYKNCELKIKNQEAKTKKEKIKQEEYAKVYNAVIEKVKEKLNTLTDDLKQQQLKIIKKIIEGDKDKQILLLPYFFKLSLGKNGHNVPDELITILGLANLYGWAAYTIYDDFLDEEGSPNLLPAANLCLRELTNIFTGILDGKFASFFRKVMDTLEASNAWEVANCRIRTNNLGNMKIPDYKDFSKLAERSLGHALGPIAILFSLGYKEDSKEVKGIFNFFKHYIIARQLNDDAHDWEEDFKKGQINSVGAMVLNIYYKKFSADKTINFKKIQEKLQNFFWYSIIIDICNIVEMNTELARKSLQFVAPISEFALFEKLLNPLENIAKKTRKEQQEIIKFLKTC